MDTVEEVQLKSTGYAAEYGGTTGGGVVNVVTKSGTNGWHVDARVFFTGERARRGRAADTPAECGGLVARRRHVTYPKDCTTGLSRASA